MRRLLSVLLLAILLVGLTPRPSHAGGAAVNIALGLASFAVFNQLVGALIAPPIVYAQPVIVYRQPTVYAIPQVVYTAPPTPTVVQYPHGRYELRGDGVTTAYQWIWIPAVPPPPPPPR